MKADSGRAAGRRAIRLGSSGKVRVREEQTCGVSGAQEEEGVFRSRNRLLKAARLMSEKTRRR